jgi:hypothetical protein
LCEHCSWQEKQKQGSEYCFRHKYPGFGDRYQDVLAGKSVAPQQSSTKSFFPSAVKESATLICERLATRCAKCRDLGSDSLIMAGAYTGTFTQEEGRLALRIENGSGLL